MVIGPTPPGTGVIAPATAAAEAKSTSPTSRVRPSRSMRLMPTSITVAPGFTQAPGIISGRPTAATRMSARRQIAPRSRLRLWARVTVALSPRRSWAMGLPTMFERPTTTASAPERSPRWSRSISRQPSGVQGAMAFCPVARRPTLAMVKPSTSLAGSMASMTASARIWAGSGSWTRMPCTAGSAFSRATSASRSASGVSAGSLCSKEAMPASRVCRPLLRT